MNITIMRRLENLEKRFTNRETPSLLLIRFDAAAQDWVIGEQYTKHDGRGNVIAGGKRTEKRVKDLAGYIIPADCNAQIILDFMECENGAIATVHTGEIRKAAQIGKAAFAIVQIDPPTDHAPSSPAGDVAIKIDVYGKDETQDE